MELFEKLWKNGLNSPEASKCGELFTLMLTRCWPKPKEGIPCSSLTILKHVLEWKLWPCFFHRFGILIIFLSRKLFILFKDQIRYNRFKRPWHRTLDLSHQAMCLYVAYWKPQKGGLPWSFYVNFFTIR